MQCLTLSLILKSGKAIRKKSCRNKVLLKNSRIIYNWEGAFTLNALSTKGITGGKISKPVEFQELERIGITLLSEEAESTLLNYEI